MFLLIRLADITLKRFIDQVGFDHVIILSIIRNDSKTILHIFSKHTVLGTVVLKLKGKCCICKDSKIYLLVIFLKREVLEIVFAL